MQKDMIIQRLKERGCRITKQRLLIVDIILENECSCCKEIHFRASGIDPGIGTATVYRLVNTLEEIGAISRKNMYKVTCEERCSREELYTIVLDDDTTYQLSKQTWNDIIKAGLESFGYLKNQNVASLVVNDYELELASC
nr:transcriptional repressor [Anaeromicropila herbilytica]